MVAHFIPFNPLAKPSQAKQNTPTMTPQDAALLEALDSQFHVRSALLEFDAAAAQNPKLAHAARAALAASLEEQALRQKSWARLPPNVQKVKRAALDASNDPDLSGDERRVAHAVEVRWALMEQRYNELSQPWRASQSRGIEAAAASSCMPLQRPASANYVHRPAASPSPKSPATRALQYRSRPLLQPPPLQPPPLEACEPRRHEPQGTGVNPSHSGWPGNNYTTQRPRQSFPQSPPCSSAALSLRGSQPSSWASPSLQERAIAASRAKRARARASIYLDFRSQPRPLC